MSDYTLQSKSFYQALADSKLIGSRCQDCGYVAVPQRQICPRCHSDRKLVIEFSGRGKLAAFTVIYTPPSEMLAAGYNNKNPYCVGIVELVEGPRVNAQILGLDLSDPASIRIGTELVMTTVERGPEDARKKYLAFQPA